GETEKGPAVRWCWCATDGSGDGSGSRYCSGGNGGGYGGEIGGPISFFLSRSVSSLSFLFLFDSSEFLLFLCFGLVLGFDGFEWL
ncbi:hypothetical protein A2U01_0085529, partial [Trifolium medium]|nr:hypothetical protein [Trifolium medium]